MSVGSTSFIPTGPKMPTASSTFNPPPTGSFYPSNQPIRQANMFQGPRHPAPVPFQPGQNLTYPNPAEFSNGHAPTQMGAPRPFQPRGPSPFSQMPAPTAPLMQSAQQPAYSQFDSENQLNVFNHDGPRKLNPSDHKLDNSVINQTSASAASSLST